MTAIAADGRSPGKVPCPICGEPGDPAQRFCGQCGSASSHKCAACGEENPPGFRFCGSCGAPCESDGSSTPGLANAGPEIRWLTSYVTDDKLYCVYVAPMRTSCSSTPAAAASRQTAYPRSQP